MKVRINKAQFYQIWNWDTLNEVEKMKSVLFGRLSSWIMNQTKKNKGPYREPFWWHQRKRTTAQPQNYQQTPSNSCLISRVWTYNLYSVHAYMDVDLAFFVKIMHPATIRNC